jgi:DNA-binding response OmpR family regulator
MWSIDGGARPIASLKELPMSKAARICVIDDDVLLLGATALCLRDAGYEVLTAPGAAAGLDAIERNGADAIVTDMNMPGTSGAQLIAEVRSKWPDMPIIAMSGSWTADGTSMLAAAQALGADALLPKPFRAAELGDMLNRMLTSKGDRDPHWSAVRSDGLLP